MDPQPRPMAEDYYSVLARLIERASSDPAQLRRLVYLLAWQNLRPESALSQPLPDATGHARTIFELEQALELEQAIERLETDAARQSQKLIDPPEQASSELSTTSESEMREEEPSPPLGGRKSLERSLDRLSLVEEKKPPPAYEQTAFDQTQDMRPSSGDEQLSSVDEPAPYFHERAPASDEPVSSFDERASFFDERASSFAERASTFDERTSYFDEQASSFDERTPFADERLFSGGKQPSHETPRRESAVIILPARPPAWLERRDRTELDRMPQWQDPVYQTSVPRSDWARPGPLQFLQLVAAAIIGVVLYIGISGWVYMARQSAPYAPIAAAPPPARTSVETASKGSDGGGPPMLPTQSPAARQPALPFPLPKMYGVYAASNRQLIELAPLPIRIPDPRILLSAEITRPSRATVAGDKLQFVVFRRDLVRSAPQTVSVRVVARVSQAMKFVRGKAITTPVEDSWRIRNKSYDLKVAPIESHPEMILIRPDPGFVLPAGRYALVLNGYGYDFTVAGTITTPEQCLEQVESLNGKVLSECAKS